ncbi:hypothetical protein [Pseudonocardia alni]|uniref:hypothetical protein n=1 Tax=Pseudonocardia alni TaxID=33907 RepID=UPI0033325C11
MCGACGRPHDPDGALVAGPRRRAAVAAAATRLVRAPAADGPGRGGGVRVRAVPGGWTVTAPTGRGTVARTLGQLVDALHAGDRAAVRDALLAAAAAVR